MTSPISISGTSKTPSSTDAAAGGDHEARQSMPFVVFLEFIVITAIFTLTSVAVLVGREASTPADIPAMSAWTILTAFAAATTVLLLLLKTTRGTKLFAALFAASLFLGVGALLAPLLGVGWAVAGMSAAIIAYYANPPVAVFDLVLLLGISGIAAITGRAFTPEAMLVVLAALALYDVVAVYGTKHMVRMAKALLRRKVFFAMIMPVSPRGLRARLDAVGTGKGFVFLGTGDLLLPALLVSSITALHGVQEAVPVMIGTVIGIIALNAIFARGGGRPMPALPPIALGAIAGYAVSLLV